MKIQASNVIELLRRKGIIKRGRLQKNRLAEMSFASLLDILDEITQVTSLIPDTKITGKIHCASIGLSGAASECSLLTCRKERADELARFAVLYSDHVFFHNFLSHLSPSFGHPPDIDTEDFRLQLLDDFEIFTYLQSPIDSGILIPYSTSQVYCLSCFARSQINDEASKRINKAKHTLNKMLMKSIDIRLDHIDEEIWAECSGNTLFFEHGSMNFALDDDALVDRPRLFRQLRRDGSLHASKALTRDLALHERIVESVLYSAASLVSQQLFK